MVVKMCVSVLGVDSRDGEQDTGIQGNCRYCVRKAKAMYEMFPLDCFRIHRQHRSIKQSAAIDQEHVAINQLWGCGNVDCK